MKKLIVLLVLMFGVTTFINAQTTGSKKFTPDESKEILQANGLRKMEEAKQLTTADKTGSTQSLKNKKRQKKVRKNCDKTAGSSTKKGM